MSQGIQKSEGWSPDVGCGGRKAPLAPRGLVSGAALGFSLLEAIADFEFVALLDEPGKRVEHAAWRHRSGVAHLHGLLRDVVEQQAPERFVGFASPEP